jgi:hypothetical protein
MPHSEHEKEKRGLVFCGTNALPECQIPAVLSSEKEGILV